MIMKPKGILYLKSLLQQKLGCNISSASDCQKLIYDIEAKTGEKLGVTTMKRLLGFTSEKAAPRQSTLEILARYLGFDTFSQLDDAIHNIGDSNFDNNSDSIISASLKRGDRVNLSYSPNRILRLVHLCLDEFEVVESINGSLRKGDRIFVDSLTTGLPMIAKNVIRHGESLGCYTAGKKLGIKIES